MYDFSIFGMVVVSFVVVVVLILVDNAKSGWF